jgi:hypothetical protein
MYGGPKYGWQSLRSDWGAGGIEKRAVKRGAISSRWDCRLPPPGSGTTHASSQLREVEGRAAFAYTRTRLYLASIIARANCRGVGETRSRSPPSFTRERFQSQEEPTADDGARISPRGRRGGRRTRGTGIFGVPSLGPHWCTENQCTPNASE